MSGSIPMMTGQTVTKKFSWEVIKTSLTLRVTDGPKEITWIIRKNTDNEALRQIFEEVQLAMWLPRHRWSEEEEYGMQDIEGFEDAKQPRLVDEVTEEMSKAALKAKADAVSAKGGAWWQKDSYEDDLVYTIGHGADEEA